MNLYIKSGAWKIGISARLLSMPFVLIVGLSEVACVSAPQQEPTAKPLDKAESTPPVTSLKLESKVRTITFSPKGDTVLAYGYGSDSTIIWNIESGEQVTLNHSSVSTTARFSPKGESILTYDRRLAKLWSIGGKELLTIRQAGLHSAFFSPEEDLLFTKASDHPKSSWTVWTRNGKEVFTMRRDSESEDPRSFRKDNRYHYNPNFYFVYPSAINPKRELIAFSNSDETVTLWTLEGKQLRIIEPNTIDKLVQLAFNPQGDLLFLCGAKGNVEIFRISTGQQIHVFNTSLSLSLNSLVFSPQEDYIVIWASSSGKAKLYQLDGREIGTLSHSWRKNSLSELELSPNGRHIVTFGDGEIKLWRKDGHLLQTFEHEFDDSYLLGFAGIRFSPNGDMITALGYSDFYFFSRHYEDAKLWRINGEEVTLFKHQNSYVKEISFNPKGNRIVTFGFNDTIKLWQPNGTLLRTFKHGSKIVNTSFSPEGHLLATLGADNTVKLWALDLTKQ